MCYKDYSGWDELNGCWGEGWGKGVVREFGTDMYTLLYFKRVTIYSTWNSAQCYTAARMGGEFGGEWIRVCVAEPLHCPPETITALLMSYKIKDLKKYFTLAKVRDWSE